MSVLMTGFTGAMFLIGAIAMRDGLMFTNAWVFICCSLLLAKEEKRRG